MHDELLDETYQIASSLNSLSYDTVVIMWYDNSVRYATDLEIYTDGTDRQTHYVKRFSYYMPLKALYSIQRFYKWIIVRHESWRDLSM
jgi:hypothetical protein